MILHPKPHPQQPHVTRSNHPPPRYSIPSKANYLTPPRNPNTPNPPQNYPRLTGIVYLARYACARAPAGIISPRLRTGTGVTCAVKEPLLRIGSTATHPTPDPSHTLEERITAEENHDSRHLGHKASASRPNGLASTLEAHASRHPFPAPSQPQNSPASTAHPPQGRASPSPATLAKPPRMPQNRFQGINTQANSQKASLGQRSHVPAPFQSQHNPHFQPPTVAITIFPPDLATPPGHHRPILSRFARASLRAWG